MQETMYAKIRDADGLWERAVKEWEWLDQSDINSAIAQ